MDEAKAHYREMLEAGKEGIILSEPHAPWVDSTSKFKIKFKLTATCELVITGWRPGKNKNKDLFGSLICESSDGLLEVAVSGFTDSHRKEIFESIDSYIGTIMSVDSNMIMEPSRDGKKWSLFLPRFAEFRKDKTEADSLDKIKEQFEAAIELA
jgi:DNA ligase-1